MPKSLRKNGNRPSIARHAQRAVQRSARDRVAAAEAAVPNVGDVGTRNAGQFTTGHQRSTTTALHTDRLPPEMAYLLDVEREFLIASYADEGVSVDAAMSADERERRLLEIPRRRRGQLEYRALLHRRVLQVGHALDVHGLFDRRGKLRAAWLSQLANLISASLSIDRLLGLARHERAPESLTEYLERVADEHERAEPADAEPQARTDGEV